MRRVIAGLIVLGSWGVAAHAQTPTPDAAVAPAAPAPAAVGPAFVPYPTTWRLFPPPAVAPPEPVVVPPAPTDPEALAVLQVLDKVCTPLVEGGDIDALTKAVGIAKRREGYVYSLTKPYSISVLPPGSNKNVCQLTIEHPIDGAKTLHDAVAYWALTKQPRLEPYRKRDKFDVAGVTRYTSSWEDVHQDGSSIGVVFVELKKPDGSPMSRKSDRAEVLYSVRGPA